MIGLGALTQGGDLTVRLGGETATEGRTPAAHALAAGYYNSATDEIVSAIK